MVRILSEQPSDREHFRGDDQLFDHHVVGVRKFDNEHDVERGRNHHDHY